MRKTETRADEVVALTDPSSEWDQDEADEASDADEEHRRETQRKNLEAFLRILPELLKEHKSEHALIVNGKLERIDADLQALIDYAYSEFPGSFGLIQPIQEELPKVHLGSPKPLA